MKKEYQPIVILISISLIIIAYWLILSNLYNSEEIIHKDFLNQKIINIPFINYTLSWWPVTHFVLFFILGFLYPNQYIIILSLGVGWEIIESVTEKYILNKEKRQCIRNGDGTVQYSTCWWAGGFSDIFFNTSGFLLGYTLSNRKNKEKTKENITRKYIDKNDLKKLDNIFSV